jgi:hypothetical protein
MAPHQSDNTNIPNRVSPDNPRIPNPGDSSNIWADLTAARAYLQTVGRSCSEASVSSDPRVVWAALALLRMQTRQLS